MKWKSINSVYRYIKMVATAFIFFKKSLLGAPKWLLAAPKRAFHLYKCFLAEKK